MSTVSSALPLSRLRLPDDRKHSIHHVTALAGCLRSCFFSPSSSAALALHISSISQLVLPDLMSCGAVLESLRSSLNEDDGFECYPFRIGSYNNVVADPFLLDYAPDTMAVLVVNTPRMFDVSFRRWLVDKADGGDHNDVAQIVPNPIQSFLTDRLDAAKEALSYVSPFAIEIDTIHDYDMTPNRRPKILMCTCGHVAGAAYYYRPQMVPALNSSSPKRMIGLSLHPRYGGNFAFRAAMVFPDLRLPADFVEPEPPHMLHSENDVAKALDLFNNHWRDGRFRDCGDPKERYSKQQTDYFARPPVERWEVISDWFHSSE
uniref:Cyanocobalamin reductase (cyanide-eliminating) n=1 Tax=Steinernema glaseri TaxID=37863 RepID=A0A1I7Y7I2_9BILA